MSAAAVDASQSSEGEHVPVPKITAIILPIDIPGGATRNVCPAIPFRKRFLRILSLMPRDGIAESPVFIISNPEPPICRAEQKP